MSKSCQTCSKIPRISLPSWFNVVRSLEKLFQSVGARNEQANLQPTMNKWEGGAIKNKRTTRVKSVNLDIIGKVIKYSFKKFAYECNVFSYCFQDLVVRSYNISHKLLRLSQFLENIMKILEWSLCRNKSGPFPLLNCAGYWKSSNTEACAKKLSQILTNNIDNGALIMEGVGLVSEFMGDIVGHFYNPHSVSQGTKGLIELKFAGL